MFLFQMIREEIQLYKRRKARNQNRQQYCRQDELKQTAAAHPRYREGVLRGHILFIGYSLIDEMTENELDSALPGIADLIGNKRLYEELETWSKYPVRQIHRHLIGLFDSVEYIKSAIRVYESVSGEEKANMNRFYCLTEIEMNGINWDSLFYMDYNWKD